MDARVCCQCGICSKGICLLLIWATLINLIFMVYIKNALCTSTIQWFFSESGIETKKNQAKISTKILLGRFLFNCFLFSGSVCSLQRPTAGSSGTMPKTPWILSKKTVFFFQPKNRFTVYIIYTVLGTILNFLIPHQKWLIRVHHIEMLR